MLEGAQYFFRNTEDGYHPNVPSDLYSTFKMFQMNKKDRTGNCNSSVYESLEKHDPYDLYTSLKMFLLEIYFDVSLLFNYRFGFTVDIYGEILSVFYHTRIQ